MFIRYVNVKPDDNNPVTLERIELYQKGLRGEIDTRSYTKLSNLKRDFFSLYQLKMVPVNDANEMVCHTAATADRIYIYLYLIVVSFIVVFPSIFNVNTG